MDFGDSTEDITDPVSGSKLALHEVLNEKSLEKLRGIFEQSDPKGIDLITLKQTLESTLTIYYEDEEFKMLFVKINVRRNGFINWDEFISHLLLEFQIKHTVEETNPLGDPITKIPRVLKSQHRHPIIRIHSCPAVLQDRSTNMFLGNYLSCSKDGVINYWSMDMTYLRSVQSMSPELKVQPTWVTDMVCLPDVNIICTSSTERDLRFYDTSAQKFDLRMVISSWEFAVQTMHYHFEQDISKDCYVICGDQGGHVKVLVFNATGKGPFKGNTSVPVVHIRYDQLLKGALPKLKVVEFRNVHTDWVRRLSYYKSLQCFVSASCCPKTALSVWDIGQNTKYCFKIGKGIYCFDFCNQNHIIATGGPDSLIRIWVTFLTTRPNATLRGHQTAIISLIFQDEAKQLISLSNDKCIKVWNVPDQTCIQTYLQLAPEMRERTPLTTFYNTTSRQIFIASMKIVEIVCSELLNPEETDGYTHCHTVSRILYSPVFKVVITCGMDSYIIVWDPWKGKRVMVIRDAHSKTVRGEIVPIEITAATFDPGYQLLLTGAQDGSLKVWNFNTGTCQRNMSIEPGCEVTFVVWLTNRILAVGWNRHVTEFAQQWQGDLCTKLWDVRHTEDVMCAAVLTTQTLATGSYNGELVFWRLETGQAYRRYSVMDPSANLKLSDPTPVRKIPTTTKMTIPKISARSRKVKSTTDMSVKDMVPTRKSTHTESVQPFIPTRNAVAIQAMMFLCTRPMRQNIGTLAVALDNGMIQIWSHHPGGGFLKSFSACHTIGDYVCSMATDANNEYLFTGHTAGYIKIWLMKGYCVSSELPYHVTHASVPTYRLIFPFMLNDKFYNGRAKRAVRNQLYPVLLSSYRAHLKPVSSLNYLDESEIVMSGSSDKSVRFWTLGGEYIGTLGSVRPWPTLDSDVLVNNLSFHAPPEIYRTASYTTWKVITGGKIKVKIIKKVETKKSKTELKAEETMKLPIFGERLKEPYLSKYISLPPRNIPRIFDIQEHLKSQLPAVYRDMITRDLEEIPKIDMKKNITG